MEATVEARKTHQLLVDWRCWLIRAHPDEDSVSFLAYDKFRSV